MDANDRFGARLGYHRRGRKVKQADLAELSGVSINALSRMETGQRLPTSAEVDAIAAALGLTDDERAELRDEAMAAVGAAAAKDRGFGPGEAA